MTLFNLAELFVKLFVKGGSDEDHICMQDGSFLNIDSAMAKIFFSFQTFYAYYVSISDDECLIPKITELIGSSNSLMQKFAPAYASVFTLYSQSEIEYAVERIQNFLFDLRQPNDIMLLISSLITNPNVKIFLRCLLCSSLRQFHIFVEKDSVNLHRPFQPVFDSCMSKINFRLMLHNAERLQLFIAPYIKNS